MNPYRTSSAIVVKNYYPLWKKIFTKLKRKFLVWRGRNSEQELKLEYHKYNYALKRWKEKYEHLTWSKKNRFNIPPRPAYPLLRILE